MVPEMITVDKGGHAKPSVLSRQKNKPSAKTTEDNFVREDRQAFKEAVTNRKASDKKVDFMRGKGASPPKKQGRKQGPLAQQNAQSQPQPQALPQIEGGSEEPVAEDEQAILDEQKREYDRLRRLGLKQLYRGQGNQDGLTRDKWAEKKIIEDAERIAAENAQKRRQEQKEKKLDSM